MSLPKVSIIIPTYKIKTKPYLDLCIDAVRNLDYPKDLLDVSIISPRTYIPKYLDVKNLHHPDDNRSFAQAVNFGIENSNQQSKHVFLLSDDTIPAQDSLKNMVSIVSDHDMIMQCLSNCDNHWLYNVMLFVDNNKEKIVVNKRFFTIEEFGEGIEKMKNAKSIYPAGLIFPYTACLYAGLIPRSVIKKVGLLDERFKDGYEDSDYFYRCKLADIKSAVCINSIIWHFGGQSTNDLVTPELTAKNKKLFEEKWA